MRPIFYPWRPPVDITPRRKFVYLGLGFRGLGFGGGDALLTAPTLVYVQAVRRPDSGCMPLQLRMDWEPPPPPPCGVESGWELLSGVLNCRVGRCGLREPCAAFPVKVRLRRVRCSLISAVTFERSCSCTCSGSGFCSCSCFVSCSHSCTCSGPCCCSCFSSCF